MVFLPPNLTVHYQPLDAGIIANFKNHYRMTQYRHAAIKYSSLERNKERIQASGSSEAKQKPYFWIDQLQAMNWIKMSCEKATSDTIKNAWRHTTLLHPNSGIDEDCNSPESVSNAIVDSGEDLEFDFEENSGIFMNQVTAITDGEVVNIDATLIEEDGCQSEKEEDDESTHHVKQEELVNAMKFVMDNIVAKTEDEFETLEAFSKLYTSRRDEMISNRVNQTTINSYFSK
jgi:hypothetical protein